MKVNALGLQETGSVGESEKSLWDKDGLNNSRCHINKNMGGQNKIPFLNSPH